MKYFPFVAVFILILGFTSYAQNLPTIEPCKITIEEFPSIENLRIGMSFSEVERKVGKFNDIYPWLKYGRMVFLKPSKSKFQKIDLTFLDDDLRILSYTYNSGPGYGSIEEYARNISLSFGLPHGGWSYFANNFSDGSGIASMQCFGFVIKATLIRSDGTETTFLGVEDDTVTPTLNLREYEMKKMKARIRPKT